MEEKKKKITLHDIAEITLKKIMAKRYPSLIIGSDEYKKQKRELEKELMEKEYEKTYDELGDYAPY